MTIVRPSILAGFMELLPQDQILFNNMMDTIRDTYERFGFLPIDTPVLEKSEVLLAKGGGETEKQVYRFERGKSDISMRFDLTVPLARYVGQYYSDLEFPFRRYHIGKVYRGERNQRGRFREFYQCDIDIIGDGELSIINDAEIPAIIYQLFKDLDIGKFTIRINNRKILNGFYDYLKIEDKLEVLRTVDKLEKIGADQVRGELIEKGIGQEAAQAILDFISIRGSNKDKLGALKDLGVDNELFKKGLEEIQDLFKYLAIMEIPEEYTMLDLTIARGLDYYTGTVYETLLDDHPEIGSICSGGRYDDLAGHYIKRSLPGVGISIGLTRLFYQLKEADLIKDKRTSLTDILIVAFDEYLDQGMELLTRLRQGGLEAFIYTEKGKLGKKMKYADNLNIPYVLLIGEEEVKSQRYSLRDMKTGDQENLTIEEIIEKLK